MCTSRQPELVSADEKQAIYVRETRKLIDNAALFLKQGAAVGSVMSYLANGRRDIAALLNQEAANKYGRLRIGALYSPMTTGLVGTYNKKVRELTAQQPNKYHCPLFFTYYKNARTIRAEINGQRVELTSYFVEEKYVPKFEYEHLFGSNPEMYPSACIAHAPYRDLPSIEAYITQLATHFLLLTMLADMLILAAQIVWWMSQGTLWERGSCAIMEMQIKSLFRAKDLEITWSDTTRLDMEALISPDMNDFVIRFSSFVSIRKIPVISPLINNHLHKCHHDSSSNPSDSVESKDESNSLFASK